MMGGARKGTPAARAIDRLIHRGQTIAVAESCTGGGLGAELTSIPGSSEAFVGGVIAYSDRIKMDLLNVSEEALDRHGAVSKRVAEEMAAGARSVCKADWGIGITGVAGPGGGSAEKPIGTVWIAVVGPGSTTVRIVFDGDRSQVREQATTQALEMLLALAEVSHG